MKRMLSTILLFVSLTAITDDGALNINTNGTPGTKGRDGSDGSNALFTGGNGTPGSNGYSGTAGGRAGNIVIQLKATSDRQFVAKGTAGNSPVNRNLIITAPINLSAHGGDGGEGGRGGDGGDGATGATGTPGDAHAGRSGGPGGPGGNGAYAGDAGAGGDAGDGGDILVMAPFEDIFLFALLDSYDTSAGTPGRAGRAGIGGSAGLGGSGGSGDSYQEPYEVTIPGGSRTIEHSDGTTEVQPYPPTTETRYRTISVPGGPSGSSGSSGANGASASDGVAGTNGRFFYEIEFPDGRKKRYQRIFNLVLGQYVVVDENNDGIYEPGERGFVVGMVVRNSGGMPTPPPGKSQTLISLRGDAWHSGDTEALKMPFSLDEGSTHKFDKTLGFRIRDIKSPSIDKPFLETITIDPRALYEPISRDAKEFVNPLQRNIEFPVKLKVQVPPALAQGERGLVRITVRNSSGKDLGKDSESQRLVHVLLKEHGIHEDTMHLSDREGNPISLRDGVEKIVANLKAHDAKVFEAYLDVPHNFPDQSAFTFHADMMLGGLYQPESARSVQTEVQRVSVATKYHTEPNTSIMLIVTNQTEKVELDGWKSLLEEELGFNVGTWNTAYYANFDIDKKVVDDPRWHLTKDFMSRPVFILNERFKAHNAEFTTSWELLSKEALRKSIGTKDTTFLVIGPEPVNFSSDDLVSPRPGSGSRKYPNTDAMIRSLDILHRDRLTYKHRSQIHNDHHKVRFTAKYYFAPKRSDVEDALIAKAKDLSRQLKTLWPNRRYLVAYDTTNSGTTLTAGGTFSKALVDVGEVIVQRLPDYGDSSISVADVEKHEMNDPAFWRTERGLKIILSGLSYQDKVALFDRLMASLSTSPSETQKLAASLLVDSMGRDIAREYDLAVQGGSWRGSATPRTVSALIERRFNKIRAGSAADEMVISLYTRAKILGYYSYSSVPYCGGRAKVVYLSMTKDLDAWLKALYESSKDVKVVRKDIDKRWDSWMTDSGAKKEFWNSNKLSKIQNAVVSAGESDARADGEKFLSLVVPYSEIKRVDESSEAAEAAWKSFTESNLKARKETKFSAGGE